MFIVFVKLLAKCANTNIHVLTYGNFVNVAPATNVI